MKITMEKQGETKSRGRVAYLDTQGDPVLIYPTPHQYIEDPDHRGRCRQGMARRGNPMDPDGDIDDMRASGEWIATCCGRLPDHPLHLRVAAGQ